MSLEAQYLRQLQALLPSGQAWPREDGADLTKQLQVISNELARAHKRGLQLLEESDPRTTLETLGDWETDLGLPDDCVHEAEGIRQRRAAVVAKWVSEWGQSKSFYEGFARLFGVEVELIPHRPFMCGISHTGKDALNGPASCRYYGRMVISGQRVVKFQCGVSECGVDKLTHFDNAEELECWLHKLAQAHTHLTVGYGG